MQTLIVLFALVAQDPVVVSGAKTGGATGALEIHLPADYRFDAAGADVKFNSGEYLTKPPQSSNGRHAWTGLQPGVVNVLFRDASSMLVAIVRIEPGVSKRFQFDPQRLIPARGTVTDGAGAVVSAVSITSHTYDGIALKTWAKADAQGAYTVRVLPQTRVLDPAYAAMTFGEGDRRRTLEPNTAVQVYVDDDSPQNFRIDGSIRAIGGRRFFAASGIHDGEFSKERPAPASLDLPAFRLIPCDRSFDAKLPAQGTLRAFALGHDFGILGPAPSRSWIEVQQGLLPATRVLFVFTPADPSTAAFAYAVADLATTSSGSLSLDALGTVRGKIAGFDRHGEIQQAFVLRGVTFAPSELETVVGVRSLFTVFADKEGSFEGRIPAGSYKASAYATVATKTEFPRDRDVPVGEVAAKLLERLRDEKSSPASIDVTLTSGGTKDVNFQISK